VAEALDAGGTATVKVELIDFAQKGWRCPQVARDIHVGRA